MELALKVEEMIIEPLSFNLGVNDSLDLIVSSNLRPIPLASSTQVR